MKKFLVGLVAPVLALSLWVPAAHAVIDFNSNLEEVNDQAGFGNQPLEETLGLLINVLLSFLGVICLVLVLYAGFLWMTAGGDDKKVGTAKNIMINAVVGLIVLLSAYAISTFVIEQISTATGS